MIAADSSTWIAFLEGDIGADAAALAAAIRTRQISMVPAVLCELYSSSGLSGPAAAFVNQIPLLELQPDYWKRTGELRAALAAKGRKAGLGDALIAQCCLDHDVPLLTRDRDFLAFASHCGLHLAQPGWLN